MSEEEVNKLMSAMKQGAEIQTVDKKAETLTTLQDVFKCETLKGKLNSLQKNYGEQEL